MNGVDIRYNLYTYFLSERREVVYRFPIAPTRECIHPMRGRGSCTLKGKLNGILGMGRRSEVKYRFPIVPAQRNSSNLKE
jgi:hypothetical protein